jgi:hypothetical protein
VPDHPLVESSTPSPEAIREQLRAILAGRQFATAARARRFLTYVVEQTLAGHSDSIKELVLGIEVFDRPSDFDPKIDPIVRVEAGKLRKRLEEYYSDDGVSSDLRIEIPRGSYIPQFQVRVQTPELKHPTPAANSRRKAAGLLVLLVAAAGGGWWGWRRSRTPGLPIAPSIAVLPFLNLSSDPANEYFTDGLAEELTAALSNAGNLRVAARTSAFFFKGKATDIHEVASKLHVAFPNDGW